MPNLKNQNPTPTNTQNQSAKSRRLNPKLVFIILFLLFIVVSEFFVYQNFSFKQNNLVQCSSRQTISQIMEQIRAGSTVETIEKKEFKITGFYIDKENAQLEGRAKQKADKFGWQDFIEGYEPPTPLLDLKDSFQYGDLIEIIVDQYIDNASTGDEQTIQVAATKKLGLPTEHDFSKSANQIFKTNEKAIFSCANSKPADFTPINYLTKPSVRWNQEKEQATVIYSKNKPYLGLFKVVNIVVIMDRRGDPISILVTSHTTPGD